MARTQFRSRKKVTGKKYLDIRKKRLSDLAGNPAMTSIGKNRLKLKRTMGGNEKKAMLSVNIVYVSDKGKVTPIEIMAVENNPANINFTRRNIITKGSIVKTSKGSVRITSRPGQSGTLFGVFNQ